MSETLYYLEMFLRLPFSLRRHLKHMLTLDGGRGIVRERMEHREVTFFASWKRVFAVNRAVRTCHASRWRFAVLQYLGMNRTRRG